MHKYFINIFTYLDENQYKFGYQRLWGAIGWGTMSIISGMCIDWYSKGEDDKNYLPAYIIALVSFSLNLYVVMKIKASIDRIILIYIYS